ncbi:hypothetical protein RB628_42065, partial [Streptomyces sp. ADMS]|nr:hypothetical protein [Streptomyces sp. ADMS]
DNPAPRTRPEPRRRRSTRHETAGNRTRHHSRPPGDHHTDPPATKARPTAYPERPARSATDQPPGSTATDLPQPDT